MTLEARAQRREQLIKLAKDSVVDRASKLYVSQYKTDLEHLKPGDQVEPHIPVGKDKFVTWVKNCLNQFFPEVSGATENEKILKEYAVQIAQSVAQSNTEMQNPMRDYEISKDPIFVRAGNKVYTKKAQTHMTESNDQKADPKTKNLYTAPTEHSRYCPDHPGSMMRRVSDNVYQCPISGEISVGGTWKESFSYDGGHEVRFDTGVQNQTSEGWNHMHPILPFLSTGKEEKPLGPKGKEYGYEREKLYGVKSPEFPFRQSGEKTEKESALLSRITRSAQYNEKFFGETTVMTRQCPDHPGQQLARLEDNVRQCPLDNKIYDFERGFTTEDGVTHSGGSVNNQHSIPPGSIIIKKEAQANDTVHAFMYTHVLPYLGAEAEYARRVLNHKFSKPGLSLEAAILEIKKADELAAAQKEAEKNGEPVPVVQPATAQLKGFTRKA